MFRSIIMTRDRYAALVLLLAWCATSTAAAFVTRSPTANLAAARRHCNNENPPQQQRNRQTIRTTATQLGMGKRMKFQAPSRMVAQTEYIRLETDDEAWKLMDIVDILQGGGVGVIPTDTGYALITPLLEGNKRGLERLEYTSRQFQQEQANGESSSKKSDDGTICLACSDLKTIGEYCYNIDKNAFKILKQNLPGPFSFILLGSRTLLPKSILEGNKQVMTVQVRVPDDPILRYLQDELLDGMPLLMSDLRFHVHDGSSNFDDKEAAALVKCYVDQTESWCHQVDFIVDAGGRSQVPSTLYDLTRRGEPVLVTTAGVGELLPL